MDIVLLNCIPFILALVLAIPNLRPLLNRQGMAWLSSGVMAGLFVAFLTYFNQVKDEGAIEHVIEWVPELGLTITTYLDGLSLMFALIVTGVGSVVFLYAGYYFDDADEAGRFMAILMTFAGAMLALVLAGNVLTLFIAWELTSITSFLLIGFKGDKYESAREGAVRALIITGGGGLALLVGLLLMGIVAGGINGDGFQLQTLLTSGDLLREHSWYEGFTILVLLGAFTKSAQFPFHFWLPGGMSAPSPASAYLHSATMVKAGIYLLLRFKPVLGDTHLWENSLMVIGLTTFLLGAVFALHKRDLKALLAYSTISKLGAIVALIGLPDGIGLKAATAGIIAHALYKGTFFLLAGTIEHATGTRNLDQLGGLRKHLPATFVVAGIVGLSMAGYPPLFGFIAKEILLDAFIEDAVTIIPITIAVIASIFTGVAALLYVWDTFVSRPDTEYEDFHAPSPVLTYAPAVLAVMSVITAFILPQAIDPLISEAIHKDVHLHLVPTKINEAVIISLLILVIAPAVFALRGYWLKLPELRIPSGATVFKGILNIVDWLGDRALWTQWGKVRYYLAAILVVVPILIFIGRPTLDGEATFSSIDDTDDILRIALITLTIGATFASIVLRKHLLAALALGVSGYSIGGLFLLEPAPDVALVQFLVETLGTVLIIIMIGRIDPEERRQAMARLWRGKREDKHWGLYRDIAISVAIGAGVGFFALASVGNRPERNELAEPIALWHIENTYNKGGVTDTVSAILTDFRGMDTLIEITVFSLAALGVLTLLAHPEGREIVTGKRMSGVMKRIELQTAMEEARETDEIEAIRLKDFDPTSTQMVREFQEDHDVIRFGTPLTRTVATIVMPFALMIAIFHVLYGGGAPGDGFTGGVIGGLAVGLWYVVFGYFETRKRLGWLKSGRLITLGLLLAIGNATAPILFDKAFLHLTEFGDFPAGLHMASTTLFEISIFLAVFGGVSMIMEAIAHPLEIEEAFTLTEEETESTTEENQHAGDVS